jgi:2',3'-cyclic-nucleotide 2'-phosphodiesterase/3'-nucleotidase
LLSISLYAQQTSKLIVLHTTDVHGNINPYNYFSDLPANNGLAKIYTMVKRYRTKYDNILLLDSGDLLQGTPLVYYYNHVETSVPNPMIYIMNYMQYDAFAVGNHDIEQGYHVYFKAQSESQFPWLSANGIRADQRTFFKPYSIIEKNGIKIGIVGLTTPAIPMWLDKRLYPGIQWQDMVIAARKWAAIVRPQVDVLIGLFHAGMNAEYSRKQTKKLGLPNENASRLVAKQVSQFDAIFCGHSHRRYPYNQDDEKLINNVLIVMSGSHARYIGVAEFNLKNSNENKWNIYSRNSYILKMDTVAAAQEILTINEPYHEGTLQYIRQVVGSISDTISGRFSRMQDNPVVQLINLAQMSTTKADLSFAASFNDRFVLPPGEVQVKDIYNMYSYENFLYVVEMTGQQIKDYLEYSSAYFLYDQNENKIIPNPEMKGYNYDMAEGISYQIDVREKIGNRIKNLKHTASDQPLLADKTYRVAMNSYRASGGGGHLAAAGIAKAKILWKSNQEIRNILIDYIRENGCLEHVVDNNWKLVEIGN